MMHNLDTIYRKLRMVANILPGEYEILLRDYDKRLMALEEKLNETRVEEPTPTRRRSSKVSEAEVSSD